MADKLAVARRLDELGVGFIEGGWPGALPKDTEFFGRGPASWNLRTPPSRLLAQPAGRAQSPPTIRRCRAARVRGAGCDRWSPSAMTGM